MLELFDNMPERVFFVFDPSPVLCVFDQRVIDLKLFEPLRVFEVVPRLARLKLDTAEALGHFVQDVRHAQQVLLRPFESAHRLFLVRLIFADARGLLEDQPSVRLGCTDEVFNLALFEDRISTSAYSGIHQQFADVLQPAKLIVDPVFALAAFVYLTGYLHLFGFDLQLSRPTAVGIGENQSHFRGPERFSAAAPAEYDVGHLPASQALDTLLSEHPLDSVNDVALAAAVWPDDTRYARVEKKFRLVGETLESVQYDLFESHLLPCS